MDIAKGEMVEAELDAMIRRRDEKRREEEGERLVEELWMPSERAYDERRRRQIQAAWYGWHCDQAERHRRTLEALIAHHEGEAEKLLEENGHEKGD